MSWEEGAIKWWSKPVRFRIEAPPGDCGALEGLNPYRTNHRKKTKKLSPYDTNVELQPVFRITPVRITFGRVRPRTVILSKDQ